MFQAIWNIVLFIIIINAVSKYSKWSKVRKEELKRQQQDAETPPVYENSSGSTIPVHQSANQSDAWSPIVAEGEGNGSMPPQEYSAIHHLPDQPGVWSPIVAEGEGNGSMPPQEYFDIDHLPDQPGAWSPIVAEEEVNRSTPPQNTAASLVYVRENNDPYSFKSDDETNVELLRKAVVWSEILKRPHGGIPPRHR